MCRCAVEVEPSPGNVRQCEREGNNYHVVVHLGLRIVLHLCDDHSFALTASENGCTVEEFAKLMCSP